MFLSLGRYARIAFVCLVAALAVVGAAAADDNDQKDPNIDPAMDEAFNSMRESTTRAMDVVHSETVVVEMALEHFQASLKVFDESCPDGSSSCDIRLVHSALGTAFAAAEMLLDAVEQGESDYLPLAKEFGDKGFAVSELYHAILPHAAEVNSHFGAIVHRYKQALARFGDEL